MDIAGTETDSATTPASFRSSHGNLEYILREGLDIKWENCLKSMVIGPQGSHYM